MAQIEQVFYTVLRVFFGTLLAAIVATGVGVLEWDTWEDWKVPVVGAGISAAVVILNALNWKDDRYGIGADTGADN